MVPYMGESAPVSHGYGGGPGEPMSMSSSQQGVVAAPDQSYYGAVAADPGYAQYPPQSMGGGYAPQPNMGGRMGYGQHNMQGGMHNQGSYDTTGGYGGYPSQNRVPTHQQQGYGASDHPGSYGGGYPGATGYGGGGVSESLHFSPPDTQSLPQQNGQSYMPHMYSQPHQNYGQQPQHHQMQGGHHQGPMNGGMQQPNMGQQPGGSMNLQGRPQSAYSPPHSRETSGMGGVGGGQVGQMGHDGYSNFGGGGSLGYGGGYGGMSMSGGTHLDQQQGHSGHNGMGIGLGMGGVNPNVGIGPMGNVNPYPGGGHLQDQQGMR
eukprot:Selendium_serpulae@DN6503_c0_g1_i7.p1